MNKDDRYRVGDLRPSQLIFTFGIGAMVDLPNLTVIVSGLEDWRPRPQDEIREPRLLNAVKKQMGDQVERLMLPPITQDEGTRDALGESATVGAPVATFPRWVRCPYCDLLAPLDNGLFKLETDPFRPDRTRYIHENCRRPGRPPAVVPARFLLACEHGHLDDFPWRQFVHGGPTSCEAPLRLREIGVTGEAADVLVVCDKCDLRRSMAEAFGEEGRRNLPTCRGRRPHLRDFDPDGCTETPRAILLGASNSWFPMVLSTLALPAAEDKLARLVDEKWAVLEKALTKDILLAFRGIGQLPSFSAWSDDELWTAVEAKRNAPASGAAAGEQGDLKRPEWTLFTNPDPARNTEDFQLREVAPPPRYRRVVSQVILAERLREVRALVGFTRIESPGDYSEMGEIPPDRVAPISRKSPKWTLASEVRGEGVFLRLDEAAVSQWSSRVEARRKQFQGAHRRWRLVRGVTPADAGFPGVRYVLLHSLSHALIRQFAIECGYSAAGIRERIYAREPGDPGGPMAGILLYTAAPDSEGTLGGLVSLGWPEPLGRHLDAALEQMRLCASDPLCAEHDLAGEPISVHGAACHACLFAPETSCERGNKYLDRSLLVPTVSARDWAFFGGEEGRS